MEYEVQQDDGSWITKEIDYKEIQTVIRLGSHNYSGYCSDRIIEVVNYNNKLYTKLFNDETWCSCTLGGMCGTCEINQIYESKLHKFDLELIKSMIKNSYKEELESRAKDQCCSFWIDRFQRQWGYEQNHKQFKEIKIIKKLIKYEDMA
jgi:hypothetical protein